MVKKKWAECGLIFIWFEKKRDRAVETSNQQHILKSSEAKREGVPRQQKSLLKDLNLAVYGQKRQASVKAQNSQVKALKTIPYLSVPQSSKTEQFEDTGRPKRRYRGIKY